MRLPSRAGLVTAWVNASSGADQRRAEAALDTVVDGALLEGDVVSTLEFLTFFKGSHARLHLPAAGETAGLPHEVRDRSEVIHVRTSTDSYVVLPPDAGERWWRVMPAHVPDHAHAFASRADLLRVLRESTERLTQLGLQRPDTRVIDALHVLDRDLRDQPLPRHLAGRPGELVDQASRVLLIVQLAQDSEGASVTTSEAEWRREVLREVSRTARAALAEAYSTPDTVGP